MATYTIEMVDQVFNGDLPGTISSIAYVIEQTDLCVRGSISNESARSIAEEVWAYLFSTMTVTSDDSMGQKLGNIATDTVDEFHSDPRTLNIPTLVGIE